MNRRMAMVLVSLAGFFVALYLYLYKIGKIGVLACGTGACETVQLSPQSRFLGVEVALIGVVGYAALLGLSLVSLQPRFGGRHWSVLGLLIGTGGALLFTLYLKYLELFVIHAICRWCVASAAFVAVLFGLAVIEWRRTGAKAVDRPAISG
jgi:uncharacterized membrane protein